jgi:hypothetical protein
LFERKYKRDWEKGLEGPMKMIGYMGFEKGLGKRIGWTDEDDWIYGIRI